MPEPTWPTILALDFDGVLCDGMLEYFQSTWRTYCHIWQPADMNPPPNLRESFARLRPVIATGWEMPVLIRSLLLGISESEILQNWSVVAQQILQQENLNPTQLAKTLDQIRDNWIAEDLSGWLSLHRFYPGVIETLKWAIAAPIKTVIITTKEGRFVKQLLREQGVDLEAIAIFGKECQRPKHQILRELIRQAPNEPVVWFVEDLLPTLLSVQQQPDLTKVKLYLADWGYNTEADRTLGRENPGIQLLTLTQFASGLANWPQEK